MLERQRLKLNELLISNIIVRSYRRCSKCCPFTRTQTRRRLFHSSIASSTTVCHRPDQTSTKCCFSSSTSFTGFWYTHTAVHGPKCSSQQGWGRGCWPARGQAGWTLVSHDAETQSSHVPDVRVHYPVGKRTRHLPAAEVLSTFWRFSQLIIIIIRYSLLELFQNVIGVRFFETQCKYLVFSTSIRAGVAIGFQFPYPCHTHRKICGNSHKICTKFPSDFPYPRNPEIFHTYTPHLASFRLTHVFAVSQWLCILYVQWVYLLSVVEDRPIYKRGGLQAISLLLFVKLAAAPQHQHNSNV